VKGSLRDILSTCVGGIQRHKVQDGGTICVGGAREGCM